MKLTDFATLPSQEEQRIGRVNWNLIFVTGVLLLVSAIFIYDAHSEQNLSTNSLLATQE